MLIGTAGTHGLSSATQSSTAASGLSHPSTLDGSTTATSHLPDRSVPHANIGGTTTDRSFPLGGHAGEGPHVLSTANRLDPKIPDTAEEFRQGTHMHGHNSGSGLSTTGAGLGVGALAGEQVSGHHHHGHGSHGHTADPTSRLTGASTTRSNAPLESSTSTTGPAHTSHHLGRDAAVGTGSAGLSSVSAHKHDKNRGTGGIGSTGASTGSSPTMVSGGHSVPSGHQYNTLSDGTPSGIATSDRSHPQTSTSSATGSTGHHLGRDAGVGATGLAAHEYEKRKTHPSSSSGSTGQQSVTQHAPVPGSNLPTAVPGGDTSSHPTGSAAARAQESLSNYPDRSSGQHSNLGRDATAATGVGGADTAVAYEAEKHRHGGVTHDPSQLSHTGRDATAAGGVGGVGTTAAYEAEKHKPGKGTADPTHQTHTARDATAGAGVGGAGTATAYEAEKYKHGKDIQNPPHGTQSTHNASEGQKPGLLDRILHRDPAEKEAKREEKELMKEEKQAEKDEKKAEKEAQKEHKHAEKAEAKSEDSKHHHTHGDESTFAGAGAGTVGLATEQGYRHDDPHSKHRTAGVPGSAVHGQQPMGSRYDTADGRVPTTTNTAGHSSVQQGAERAAERHGYGGIGASSTAGTSGARDFGRDAGVVGTGVPGVPGVPGVGSGGYAGDKYAQPSAGTQHSTTTGYGQGTPTTSATTRGIDPRVDNPQYGSATSGSGYGTGATGAGYDTTSPTTGAEKQGGALQNLLHRENPNKLHKDPPTSGS